MNKNICNHCINQISMIKIDNNKNTINDYCQKRFYDNLKNMTVLKCHLYELNPFNDIIKETN